MEGDLRAMLLQALVSRKQELEAVLLNARNSWREWSQGPGKGDPADEADGALRETSIHNHYSLVEKQNRELRKIDELIRRMGNDEDFGLCEECGDPIPVERLMILPDATFCVSCQGRMERRNGLRLSGAWAAHDASERRDRDWENPDDEETALLDAHIESLGSGDPERFQGGSSFEGGTLEG